MARYGIIGICLLPRSVSATKDGISWSFKSLLLQACIYAAVFIAEPGEMVSRCILHVREHSSQDGTFDWAHTVGSDLLA